MPIDPNGSRPESVSFGNGSLPWAAQNFTAKEVEATPDGKWAPKKKIGLPDQRKISQAYRDNYEKTFGHK